MSIVDLIILAIIIAYAVKGFVFGIIKEGVSFIGGILVFVAAFYLKNPVSVFMYKHFPFFNLGGALKGISVLNVVIYELIAFLLVASVLAIILYLLVKISNILNKILKLTIILDKPSKMLGMVLGVVEGVVIAFVLVFSMFLFNKTRKYMEDSKISPILLNEMPVLTKYTKSIYKSVDEIIEISEKYEKSKDREKANKEALDVLLKYKVIDKDNAEYLIETEKIDIGE